MHHRYLHCSKGGNANAVSVCTSSLRHMLLGPASYARRASQPSLSAHQHTSACHHDFASSLVLLLIFTPRISCRPICRLISFA
jgi:hypothetical protein